MIKNAENAIRALTSLGIALLGLGIVVGILVHPANAVFVGDVVGGITDLVRALGSSGLAGLISLGVILYILRD